MKKVTFYLTLVVAVSLNAANLAQEAKDAGLLPLPKTQKEIDAFFKANGIKASKFG